MKDKLKQFGFSNNAISAYEAVLKLGECKIGKIISQTGLHRQSAYNALSELEKESLIKKKVVGGVARFSPADPEILISKAKEKEVMAEVLSRLIKNELKNQEKKQEINIHAGQQNIRNFYLARNKKLPKNSKLKIVSNLASQYENVLGRKFIAEKINTSQEAKNLEILFVAGENYRQEFKKFFQFHNRTQERKVRFLSDDLMSPVAVEIWEGGICFNVFDGPEPFVLEIKNPGFYENYLKYFDKLWKIAKK